MLLEGTYIIDGSIIFQTDVTLEGQGESTEIKLINSHDVDIDLIYANNCNSIIVRQINLNGNSSIQSSGAQYGVRFESSSDCKINNCFVRNIRSIGVYTDNLSPNNTVMDNTITNCSTGINVTSNKNNVAGNIVKDCDTGILISSSSAAIGNLINSNNVSNCGTGIRLASYAKENSISSNSIFDNLNQGIYLQEQIVSTSSSPADNLISNNFCQGNGTYNIYIGAASSFNDINSNICRAKSTSDYGIYVGAGQPLIVAEENLIFNNDCYNGGTINGIYNDGSNTNFGGGNRNNDGTWSTIPN